MSKFEDLTGRTFGNWVVICPVGVREIGKDKVKKMFWLCECQCDAKTRREIPTDSLKSGNSKSCGCLKIKATVERSTIHGFARRGKNGSSIYHVWHEMKERCINKNNNSYSRYGGRGITVCDEWKDSFITFKDWAFSNGYEIGLSIDRIDNNGNYEPSNCRWTDAKTQANNKRCCRIVEINGEKKNIAQWCEIYGICPSIVYSRIDSYGWDSIKAITTPQKKVGSRPIKPIIAKDKYGNKIRFESAYDASIKTGLNISSLRTACRLKKENYGGYSWCYAEELIEDA